MTTRRFSFCRRERAGRGREGTPLVVHAAPRRKEEVERREGVSGRACAQRASTDLLFPPFFLPGARVSRRPSASCAVVAPRPPRGRRVRQVAALRSQRGRGLPGERDGWRGGGGGGGGEGWSGRVKSLGERREGKEGREGEDPPLRMTQGRGGSGGEGRQERGAVLLLLLLPGGWRAGPKQRSRRIGRDERRASRRRLRPRVVCTPLVPILST